MAPSAEPTSRAAQYEQRAQRILDAAGGLLVTWGYHKITIEDVARRAGVGKGTVYLHFPTKEVLFLAVVLRAQTAMTQRIVETMRRGPEGIWPSELARTIGRASQDSPIIAALMTGKTETLGTLARAAAENSLELVNQRLRTTQAYFDVLREHGLIRTDRSREEQFYAYSAILTGFLMVGPLMSEQPTYSPPDPDLRVDILADTVRAALGESDASGTLRLAWPKVTALFEELAREARAEVDRYTQSRRET